MDEVFRKGQSVLTQLGVGSKEATTKYVNTMVMGTWSNPVKSRQVSHP